MKDLRNNFELNDKSIDKFVQSSNWAELTVNHGRVLRNFQETYGCNDVLLIDHEGNVLFTVMGMDDLGTNIYEGKDTYNFFAKACKDAFRTGKPVFSDFGFYRPSNNAIVGFISQVMVNSNGDKIGLMAFSISTQDVNKIVSERTGLQNTGETYVVGRDLFMRSNSRFGSESTILKIMVDTKGVQLWADGELKEKVDGDNSLSFEITRASIYDDYRGVSVLGTYRNIESLKKLGVTWVLMVEIDKDEAFGSVLLLRYIYVALIFITVVAVFAVGYAVSMRIVKPVSILSDAASQVAEGDFSVVVDIKSRNEIDLLADSFEKMADELKLSSLEREKQDWFNTGHMDLRDRIVGERNITVLCREIISFLAHYLDAQIGAIFLVDNDNILKLAAKYSSMDLKEGITEFAFGEGLVGQSALEKRTILTTNVPESYVKIDTGLGEVVPRNILVVPLVFYEKVCGVIELGSVVKFTEIQVEFLNLVARNIIMALEVAKFHSGMNTT